MKIIYNNIIPFKGFTAINLFGVFSLAGAIACLLTPLITKRYTQRRCESWGISASISFTL